ncbi:MAG: SDR family oxidoreductase [Caulobacterales bacterium]|nr:SDR family oxidoreductase [Caulobacterales bacterium]
MGDRFRLDGLTAVVTGGGGGVGAAGAEALAQAGADVVLIARNRAKLEAAAGSVEAQGRRAWIVEADVTDAASVKAAADQIAAEAGKVDILFNNAGVTSPKTLFDLPPEEFRRILDVNVSGAFLCAQAFAPGMVARRFGRIINMGSILSGRGMASRTAYSASKAGLANLGAALAFELGPHGVTVNTLGATVVVTDLNRELVRTQPELYGQVVKRTALGRLGELADLTGVLVFLASDAARFITGQTLYVDGGYTAG